MCKKCKGIALNRFMLMKKVKILGPNSTAKSNFLLIPIFEPKDLIPNILSEKTEFGPIT